MAGCGPPRPEPNEDLSGGDTTVFDTSRNAFALSARNLSFDDRGRFMVGNSFFNQNWVAAPASTEARDGLGPLFNAPSCSACHFKDGRAAPPTAEDPDAVGLIFRLTSWRSGGDWHRVPHPKYGAQIQDGAIPGAQHEGGVEIQHEIISGTYPDGTPYTLEKPTYQWGDDTLRLSPRIAPAVIGMGLLEAIPAVTLERLADPDDRDGDGISGRLRMVTDPETGEPRPGRFGWKAEADSVARQTANAFQQDMGLTNRLNPTFPDEETQRLAAALPHGGDPEVEDHLFDETVFYVSTLAVPARRDVDDPGVLRGRELFSEIGCADCHHPKFRTGNDHPITALRDQLIRPYTDLLLHDMGEALADPGGEAIDREWRTPPLWGIGLVEAVNGHSRFLHDGRARNLEEAILWHGGEAEASRDAFKQLPAEDRQALLQFLESL